MIEGESVLFRKCEKKSEKETEEIKEKGKRK